MKFVVFTVLFFLVLSFFAFGQSAAAEEAEAAGYKAGYISSFPYPSSIPDRYRQNSALERAYEKGHKAGYEQKKYEESVKRGFRVEPIFESNEERTNPRGPEVKDNTSVGVEFKWPF